MAGQLAARNIQVEVDAEEEIYFRGNQTLLESVLHNLFSNSRDAFEGQPIDPKRIVLVLKHADNDGRACLEYRDNAGGIPPEIQGRIFEPFFTTKGGEGTGLGLSLSRKILHQHGGEMECESLDGETRFRIWLPASIYSGESPVSAPVKNGDVPMKVRVQKGAPPKTSLRDLGLRESRKPKPDAKA
jgi:signal transduction histidine kinase